MAISPSQLPGLPAVSNEVVWVGARAEHPLSGVQNISTFPVEIAFTVSSNPVAGDWKPATWEVGTWTNPDDGLAYYLARLEIGPNGAITLTEGNWLVWVRITTTTDKPVIGPARLKVV